MILSAAFLGAALAAASPGSGRIIVFEQAGSIAARDFAEKSLPRIRALARERGLAMDVRDASTAAPAEVHLTPLLVYQDAQGRSIFRGRYSDVDRFAQFLRFDRRVPIRALQLQE